MPLTFVCLAIALHGDTLRCANKPGGNDLVQLAEAAAPAVPGVLPGEPVTPVVPLKQLVPGKVTCRQVDANPRVAGFQPLTADGRLVARCTAQGRDLSALLVAERGPQLRDKPRSRGVWERRAKMTRDWLTAGD